MRTTRQRLAAGLTSAAIAAAALIGASAADATFPGGNGPIIFEQGGQFFTLPAAGGKQKRLFGIKGTSVSDPVVSPNGNSLAFWADAVRGDDVLSYDFKHKKLRDLTSKVKACYGEKDPSWAPNGKRLAFQCYRFGSVNNIEIYTISSTGKQPKRVTHQGGAYDPSWSPRGDKIAYIGDGAVHVVKAGGGGDRSINSEPPGLGSLWEYVDWSPQGDKLAVEALSNGIWLMDPATGALGAQLAPGAAIDPVFSPDGKRVAYVDLNGQSPELFSVAVDGSDRRQLTNGGGRKHAPTWVRR